ncbi:BLOC-1 related complex subunit 6 isoform X2 [Xylocopa sonorina]|uniref:BLOC-1 related complex subunit 6 isoform X2 n=1 Tax=Xylocopa sonorina TaxID=1818115 RepID=UPI00403AD9D9
MDSEEGETYTKQQGMTIRGEKAATTIDYDEDRLHEMTASYSEISFDSQSSPPVSELRSLIDSPDMDGTKFLEGGLEKMNGAGSRPDQLNLKNRETSPMEDEDVTDVPSYHKAMGYLQLEGTVMQDGSRSSTPCLYRQALTPQLPLLDHNVLNELEMEARKVATSVDALTENLAAILHSASALTVGCLETYRDAVCKTCDAVDHNIKSMYQLMAKCEELSKSMGPVYKLAEQIKEMKRMLELFESAMNL